MKIEQIIRMDLVPCKCGTPNPICEHDPMTNATMIECLHCHRVVGGISSRADAAEIWNKGMRQSK